MWNQLYASSQIRHQELLNESECRRLRSYCFEQEEKRSDKSIKNGKGSLRQIKYYLAIFLTTLKEQMD